MKVTLEVSEATLAALHAGIIHLQYEGRDMVKRWQGKNEHLSQLGKKKLEKAEQLLKLTRQLQNLPCK